MTKQAKPTVAVLGAGAWGTALACVAARAGCTTTLIVRDPDVATDLRTQRRNRKYLGNIVLQDQFETSADTASTLAGADIVILAIPVQALGAALETLAPMIRPGAILVNTAKGLERSTGQRLSQRILHHCPTNKLAILSGPSFAKDVSRGLPTAVTLAMEDVQDALSIAEHLSSASFRCYASDDILGVEIGGALKNVLALSTGILHGMELGDSAKAALITRGFVELLRMGRALGAQDETLMGLSGFGDLQLTCSSAQSRNYSYGIALGSGEDIRNRPLAEGVATAAVAQKLALDLGIEAPIISITQDILEGTISIADAVGQLLNRPLRTEA